MTGDKLSDKNQQKVVIITGFGPFGNHPVNASWEAVKLVNKEDVERRHGVELVLKEIPVNYGDVAQSVPDLWKRHDPKLVIHVGVAGTATSIRIEVEAHNEGYSRPDVSQTCPATNACKSDGGASIRTMLDVDRICADFQDGRRGDAGVCVIPSYDAGRFLCEYTYYTSLSEDPSKALFIHVPDINVCSSDLVARALERILDSCLQQAVEMEELTQSTPDACCNK